MEGINDSLIWLFDLHVPYTEVFFLCIKIPVKEVVSNRPSETLLATAESSNEELEDARVGSGGCVCSDRKFEEVSKGGRFHFGSAKSSQEKHPVLT